MKVKAQRRNFRHVFQLKTIFHDHQASLHNVSTYLEAWCVRSRGVAALGPLRADAHVRTLLPLYLALPAVTAPLTVHFVVSTNK